MARLRTRRDTPPGGWTYTEPTTKLKMAEEDFPALLAKVTSHRAYKGLPVDDVGSVIEAQICDILQSAIHCEGAPGEEYPRNCRQPLVGPPPA